VTPIDVPFDYYGVRRVTLYLDGYRTWSQVLPVEPPWYAYFRSTSSAKCSCRRLDDIHEVHADLEPGTGTLLAPTCNRCSTAPRVCAAPGRKDRALRLSNGAQA